MIRKPKEKVLKPVRPNVGIELAYKRRLEALIEKMNASVLYFIKASYRANEPVTAAFDASPADALRKSMKDLTKRWISNFDRLAEGMAEYFATSVEKRSSDALKKMMKDAGWTVEFKLTPAMRDVLDATVNQNVSLIRSIPEQYLKSVEGAVMRSVQTGRDLHTLTKELEDSYGVTKRRAAFIARSQNNMATASMNRVRQMEVGIEFAVWTHSSAGRQPRKSHVKAGREKVQYAVKDGWFDPEVGRTILPGELPNCRCIGRSVIKGFS